MQAIDFIKHKNKILNVAILLLSLLIASRIYKQQLKELDSLKAKEDLEYKRSEILAGISAAEKKIAAYKILLPKKDASEMINTISNLAKESNVKIVSIRPAQQQKYSEYVKIPFNLILTAPGYHALGNFISRIERFQAVYTVETIEIISQTSPRMLNINLTLNSIEYK